MANKGIENLIRDALSAGCHVIRKAHRFEVSKKDSKPITLVVFENGTAYRGDVDSEFTNAIRTNKEMRDILGIPAKRLDVTFIALSEAVDQRVSLMAENKILRGEKTQ